MKIEQLLVQHFYNAGEVTLQGMGTFTLAPDFVMPKELDKDLEIPSNAILFQYNAKATEDDGLINYIVEQTRKMKALASADLDSYLMLGKQFLNIGKPFAIEGMGVLAKSQQGEYDARHLQLLTIFVQRFHHCSLRPRPPARRSSELQKRIRCRPTASAITSGFFTPTFLLGAPLCATAHSV